VDRTVKRFDAVSGEFYASFSTPRPVVDIVALPDGKSIAVLTEAMHSLAP
jgi:hypothetical protein